jgi:hypothetical protein
MPSTRFVAAALTLSLLGGCAAGSSPGGGGFGGASPSGNAGSTGAAGKMSEGAAGSSSSGSAGQGSGGVAGASGSGTAGATAGGSAGAGSAGASGSGGAIGSAGSSGDGDPPAPRAINVVPGDPSQMSFNGQSRYLNRTKPPLGKLFLLLGGICTGTGAGGFESFIKQYGFHVFAPKTNTCVNSAPDQYKNTIKTTPNDPEANRQVGDARMELWDGQDRVDWVTVGAGQSIMQETIDAIKDGMINDEESDWGYFLNTDGTLRTTDVWVAGYSWGSQAWAMISSYVRFGRVITTSGPVNEGFPNAAWITHPSATPNDRKYLLVGQDAPYPGQTEAIFPNVIKAGWVGEVTNVLPTSPGPYTAAQHLFAMIGGNGGTTPGGHTVFCNDNPANGWLPVCKHVLGIAP